MSKSLKNPWRNSIPGDVFALQLAHESWAIMRQYRDTMGILPIVVKSPLVAVSAMFARFSPKWFPEFLAMSDDPTVIKKIGHIAFESLDVAWAPPYYRTPDEMVNHFQIFDRGKAIPCKESDTKGMALFFRRKASGIKEFLLEKLAAGELEEIASEAFSEDESSSTSTSPDEVPKTLTSSLKLKAQVETKYARKLPKATTLHGSLVALSRAMNLVFDDHGEITDTEIREQMFDVIFQGFIHQTPGYVVPETFNADSPEGDAAIRAVVTAFIKVAIPLAAREGVDTPEKRLDAFNSDSFLELDEFFGWMEHLKPLKD